MGVWGTGLFSDDTALDVRDAYRTCLAEGMEGAEATEKILHEFRSSVDDPDDGPPLWLSLAATQWRYGRLEQRVRDRALAIIDNGSDAARFSQQVRLQRARARVLEKLRERLVSPQRAPVKIRPEVPLECDWDAGEIVGFRRDSGEWVPLYVRSIVTKQRDRYPEVCVLALPFEEASTATAGTRVRDIKGHSALGNCFRIIGLKKRDRKSQRIQRTHTIVEPRIPIDGPTSRVYVPWKNLDGFLTMYLLE
jgi:hypothetical protein